MVVDAVTLSAQVMRAVLTLASGRAWPSASSVFAQSDLSPQSPRFCDEVDSVAQVLSDASGILDGPSRSYVLQTCADALKDLLENSPELEHEFRNFVAAAEALIQRTSKMPTESSVLIRPYADTSMPQISIGAVPRLSDLTKEDRELRVRQSSLEKFLAQRSELLAGIHMEFSGDRAISVRRVSRLQPTLEQHSMVVGLVEPPFELLPSNLYGKDEALSGLEGGLDDPDGNIHLLCGEPGAGKRIAALAAAANAKEHGKRVWWVRATPELIGASMASIAVELDADPVELAEAQAGRRSLSDLVWECLERASVPWLLVFDDVDSKSTLERFLSNNKTGSGWIRPSKAGIVLVTSRYSGSDISSHHLVIHQVKPFGLDDAVRFLMSSAPSAGTEYDAAKLAEYLSGSPLACKLAAGYITSPVTPITTFREYLDEIKESAEKWLAHIRQEDEDPWLSLNIRIILHAMNRPENAGSWTLLAILAYCAPGAPLATSVLDPETLAEMGLPPWVSAGHTFDSLFMKSFSLLVSLGLIESITEHAEEATAIWQEARMHPLISLACRVIIENRPHVAGIPQSQIWVATATLLRKAADRQSEAGDLSWIGGYQLTPHILAAVVNLPDSSPAEAIEEAVLAARTATNHLTRIGAYYHAEQLARRAIELSRNLSHDNPATLEIEYDLARILMNRGRLGEAQGILQAMLATSQLARGLDNKASVDALELLASLLQQQGETDQAEQLLRQVTRARERTDGLESAATISALTALARVLSEQGKLGEMERLTRGVLSTVRSRYGAGNQETLSAEMELGTTFRVLGRLNESEQILRQALESQESLLGSDHPDTCNTMVELAETYRDLGHLALAEQTLLDVVARRDRILGPDDLDTVNAEAQLAQTLRDQARFDESRTLLRQVLDVRRQTLGAEHPETLNTRLGLAVLLGDTGQLAEADRLLNEIVAICENSLQPEHPVALSARHNLATIFQATGRVEEAEQLYRDVLDKREWTLGPNHPETLRTLVNLGSLLHLRGFLDDAEHTLRQAEAAYSKIYGRRHPHTMTVMTNIANVLLDSGMVQQAKDAYIGIFDVQNSDLGANHPDTLTTRVNLAIALARLGDVDQSKLLLTEAITGYRHVFETEDHPSLLKTRYHLASLQERDGEYQSALDGYIEILNLQVKKLGANHADAIVTRLSVSRVLEILGRVPESDSEYKQAIRLTAQSPGRLRAPLTVGGISGQVWTHAS
jgi:tetratricopeptide (TPR) repeat protein